MPDKVTMKKGIGIFVGTIVVLSIAFVLYLAIGNALAVAQIDREWQTTQVETIQTHNHPDHIGGAQAWDAQTLIVGDPAIELRGKPVYLPTAMNHVSGQPIVVIQPTKMADGVASIGPIAFADFFPFSFIPHVYLHNTEQALAVNVEGKGIVLISGCGHQTVERMVARAQAVFDEPIAGLVGGIHYQDMTRDQLQTHVAFVSALHPQLIAVSPHDRSPDAMQAFRDAFPNAYQEIQVGRVISFGASSAAHAQGAPNNN